MRRRQRRWGRLTFSQAGEGGESGADGHGRELLFRRHFFCGRGFGVGARETLEEQPRTASEAAASFFVEDSELCHFSLSPARPTSSAEWVDEKSLAETLYVGVNANSN